MSEQNYSDDMDDGPVYASRDMNLDGLNRDIEYLRSVVFAPLIPREQKFEALKGFFEDVDPIMTMTLRLDSKAFKRVARALFEFLTSGKENGFHACLNAAFPNHHDFCRHAVLTQSKAYIEKLSDWSALNAERPEFNL